MTESLAKRNLASPDWLLAGFDAEAARYQFARVNRETYSQSPFLDHRIQPVPQEVESASVDQVDQLLDDAASSALSSTWILHTAFCASTLLAACLDRQGSTLVLKEPLVLSRLAQDKRSLQDAPGCPIAAPGWSAHVQRVVRLCERRYGDEQVIVKPSNFANTLAPDILATDGNQRRLVLMSSSLLELLVSVLKKREEAERLMPGFLASLLLDSDYLVHTGPLDIARLSLLQQAVVFWHCQRYQMQCLAESLSGERYHLITMRQFFDDPALALQNVVDFAGLSLSRKSIDAAINEKVLSSHSKNQGSPYSPEHHRSEAAELVRVHRDSLQDALSWAQTLFGCLMPVAFPGEADPVGDLGRA